jgi:hypothetical protein
VRIGAFLFPVSYGPDERFEQLSKAPIDCRGSGVFAPDDGYIATAETIQNGGFGSAGISTSVYIAQAGHPDKKTEILEFACD